MEARVLNKATASDEQVIAEITADAGVNLKDCYQCGKCSAGCPVAAQADMTPRQVIRNLQLGLVDPVLHAKMPWLCVGCAVCVARCPQNVDLPALMEAICREATAKGTAPLHEGEKFNNIFLDNLQHKGVSDEVMLAGRFNLETGHLFQDVPGVPGMLKQGLLPGAKGHKLQHPEEVTEMIKRLREQAAPGSSASSQTAKVGE